MSGIAFHKVEALQNDFIVVHSRAGMPRWAGKRVRAICDRRTGVGADGLIVLGPMGKNGIPFRLFNCDGTRAEWSGNGVRGATAILAARHSTRRDFHLLTDAGCIRTTVIKRRRDGVEVAFVRPLPEIPSGGQPSAVRFPGFDGPLFVDAGNPHWIFWIDDFDSPWPSVGAACQDLARSTHGINVEFVRVKSRRGIELRLYERGVGPTPSSGSGALAAFAACLDRDLVDHGIRIDSPGGTQRADYDPPRREIRLIAPARIVFSGIWQG